MTIIELLQKQGLERLGRFYSVYRGIVLSNEDPSNTNCLLVHIPNIHDGVQTWARSRVNEGGPDCGFQLLAPRVGQIVYVEFEGGDPHRALWSYHGWAEGEKPDDFNNNTLGIITPSGNKILLKEEEGELYIEMLELVHINAKDIDLIKGEVGIPESTKLIKKINQLEETLNAFMDAFRRGIPIPQDGGKGFQTSVVSKMKPNITTTKVEDIASEHIKQPN